MDERFIAVLQRIKTDYGEEIFQNVQKTRGLLLDLAPDFKKETYLFLNLLRAGGYKEVREAEAAAFYRLLDIMESVYSVRKSAAAWVINVLSELLSGLVFDFHDAGADEGREQDGLYSPISETENTVALGLNHTVAVTEEGSVLATGNNDCGQCDVHTFSGVVSVYAVGNYTAALTENGKVLTTGDNFQPDVSVWEHINQLIPTDGRLFALNEEGRLLASFKGGQGFEIEDKWDNLIFAAASKHLVAGIKNTGKVVVSDARINVSHWRDMQSICVSNSHIAGLRKDGRVLAAGRNNFSQCAVENWRDIVQISVGESNFLIIDMAKEQLQVMLDEVAEIFKNDPIVQRRLERFNFLKEGIERDYDSLENASEAAIENLGEEARGFFLAMNSRDTDLAAKFRHTFMNMKKCIDELERYDGCSACHTAGLRADGTVVATGWNGMGQCDTEDFSSVRRIVTSGLHTVGIRYDKTVAVAGADHFNQRYAEAWKGIEDVYVSGSGEFVIGLQSGRRLCSVGNDTADQCNIDFWSKIGRSGSNE